MSLFNLTIPIILKEKHVIPIVCSVFIGLIYLFLFKDLMKSIIIFFACLLFIEFLYFIYGLVVKRVKKNMQNQKELEKCRRNLDFISGRIETFFRSMGKQKLNIACELYRHPIKKNQKKNERYVDFGEEPGWKYINDLYQFEYRYGPIQITCICFENQYECYGDEARHIVFDPIFYEILKNYIETGEKNIH